MHRSSTVRVGDDVIVWGELAVSILSDKGVEGSKFEEGTTCYELIKN